MSTKAPAAAWLAIPPTASQKSHERGCRQAIGSVRERTCASPRPLGEGQGEGRRSPSASVRPEVVRAHHPSRGRPALAQSGAAPRPFDRLGARRRRNRGLRHERITPRAECVSPPVGQSQKSHGCSRAASVPLSPCPFPPQAGERGTYDRGPWQSGRRVRCGGANVIRDQAVLRQPPIPWPPFGSAQDLPSPARGGRGNVRQGAPAFGFVGLRRLRSFSCTS